MIKELIQFRKLQQERQLRLHDMVLLDKPQADKVTHYYSISSVQKFVQNACSLFHTFSSFQNTQVEITNFYIGQVKELSISDTISICCFCSSKAPWTVNNCLYFTAAKWTQIFNFIIPDKLKKLKIHLWIAGRRKCWGQCPVLEELVWQACKHPMYAQSSSVAGDLKSL